MSVLKVVNNGGDNTHVFDVGRGLVGALDAELALCGGFDFAYTRVGVLSEAVSSLAGVFGRFGNHFGLDGVKAGELVVDVVIVGGNALFEQFALTVEQFAHFAYLGGGHGNGDAQVILIAGTVAAIDIAFGVVEIRRVNGYLVGSDSVVGEEFDNYFVAALHPVVEFGEVVSGNGI